jgi:DNA invertase Pin-like site-specific DNA recombinase
MNKVAIYTRVSSEEQLDGHSLSAQQDIARQFAETRGWQVVKVYEERGRSGKTVFRPEFQQMLADVEAGLFNVLVVHKLDRFSRSLVDVMVYLKRLSEKGISFVSCTEQFDMTTPMGKMMLAFLAAMAEWYLDNLRAEIMKGKKERARKGFWNGQLSYGYTTPKKLEGQLLEIGRRYKAGELPEAEYVQQANLIETVLEEYRDKPETAAIPCPFAADAVRYAFQQYATGQYSDRDIATLLNHRGYRISARRGSNLFGKHTIKAILLNRFYLGETSYGKRVPGESRKWMPGNHAPLISNELFEICTEVRRRRAELFDRGWDKRSIHVYPLSGLLFCLECGTRWKGWNCQGRRYRDPAQDKDIPCSQSPRSRLAEHLEAEAFSMIAELQVPESWQQRVRDIIARDPSNQPDVHREHRENLQMRLARLKKLYVAGDLSDEDYQSEAKKLNQQLDALPAEVQRKPLDLERAAKLLQDFPALYAAATPAERKALYQALFRKIYVSHGKIKAAEPMPILWALIATDIPVAGRTRL